MTIIWDDRTFSEKGYVAPTVYLRAGKFVSAWNYYATKEDAYKKYLYLMNQGGSNVNPVGSVQFRNDGTAQTVGINVNFYAAFANYWTPVSYKYLRDNINTIGNHIIFQFYTTDGSGTYWAIFNTNYFGISATVVSDVSQDKLAALDSFHREVQLLKYRYNSIAAFLNTLSQRQLNAKEQMIFNQGVLLVNNLRYELTTIRGVEITFNSTGQAVGLPVFLLIGIIAILAGATAWTVSAIITEKEKTKRINESYQLAQWVANKKQEIAAQVTAGQISQAEANGIYSTLDKATATANQVANNASKPGSNIFSDMTGLIKWGVIGLIAYTGYKLVTDKKQTSTT